MFSSSRYKPFDGVLLNAGDGIEPSSQSLDSASSDLKADARAGSNADGGRENYAPLIEEALIARWTEVSRKLDANGMSGRSGRSWPACCATGLRQDILIDFAKRNCLPKTRFLELVSRRSTKVLQSGSSVRLAIAQLNIGQADF